MLLLEVLPSSAEEERPTLSLQFGHTLFFENSAINHVAYATNGRTVASSGGDPAQPAQVRLWDAPSGDLLGIAQGQWNDNVALAFAPNDDVLVTGGGTLDLWDARSGKHLRSLEGKRIGESALAFSRDSRLIAAGGIAALGVWNVGDGSGKQLWSLEEDAMDVAFSPDAKLLVTAEFSNEARLRDAATGRVLITLKPTQKNINARITHLCFSPDGALVAAAGEDGTLRVWRATDGKLAREWKAHREDISNLAFLPDSATLASGGRADGVFRFWHLLPDSFFKTNLSKVQLLRSSALPTRSLMDFSWAPDFRAVAYTDGRRVYSQHIIAWRDEPQRRNWSSPLGTLPIAGIAFSPDGSTLAASCEDEGIRFWDLKGATLQRLMRDTHSAFQNDIAFSPDGKWLANSRSDHDVLWDVRTGKPVRRFAGDQGSRPAFSPDGKLYAVDWGGNPGPLDIYEVTSGRRLCRREGFGPIVFLSDNKTAVSGGWWGATFPQIEFWDARTGKLLRVLHDAPPRLHGKINWAARGVILLDAATNGRSLVCLVQDSERNGKRPAEIQLWNAATGARRSALSFGSALARFSPDGKSLAVLQDGKRVQVWDVASAQLTATWEVAAANLANLCFSPSGLQLACATQDGAVSYWNLRDRRLLATLQILPPQREDAPSNDWIIYTPDNFYDCSPGAEKYLRWRVGDKLYPTEKFAAQFHQPQKVREALRAVK